MNFKTTIKYQQISIERKLTKQNFSLIIMNNVIICLIYQSKLKKYLNDPIIGFSYRSYWTTNIIM